MPCDERNLSWNGTDELGPEPAEARSNRVWLSLPYVIFFLAFVAYPLVFSFVLIFHRWNIITPMEWVGLKNFERLIADPLFYRSLGNTLTFLVIHIPLQIAVALGFALLLNVPLRGGGSSAPCIFSRRGLGCGCDNPLAAALFL